MTPEISVIMSVHDDAPTLQAAIDSILTQSFTDLEFIIINDGSRDGTPELLAAQSDPRVIVLHNATCIGLPASLNRGLAAARGRFIARMDADDVSLPERLAIQHAFLRAHPEIGVCGSYVEKVFPAKGKTKIVTYPTDPEEARARIHMVCPMAHMTVLARREVYDASGGYNPFYRRAQDVELWGRVALHFDISNVPQPLVRVTSRDRMVNLRGLFYGTLARLRTALRHPRPHLRVIEVIGKLAKDIRRGIVQRLVRVKHHLLGRRLGA